VFSRDWADYEVQIAAAANIHVLVNHSSPSRVAVATSASAKRGDSVRLLMTSSRPASPRWSLVTSTQGVFSQVAAR
jgi:hypothetical protein